MNILHIRSKYISSLRHMLCSRACKYAVSANIFFNFFRLGRAEENVLYSSPTPPLQICAYSDTKVQSSQWFSTENMSSSSSVLSSSCTRMCRSTLLQLNIQLGHEQEVSLGDMGYGQSHSTKTHIQPQIWRWGNLLKFAGVR